MASLHTTLFKRVSAPLLALTFGASAHANSDDILSHAFHNNPNGPGFNFDAALDHAGIDRGYFSDVDKSIRILPAAVPESERYIQEPERGDRALKVMYPDGMKLKAIFFATTPDKVFDFFSAQTGIGQDVLASMVSAKELSAVVLRHETSHHAHTHNDILRPDDENERSEQRVLLETEADTDAIRAIEAKNPQSRIREIVYAYRVLDDVYGNALPLKYALENRELPPLPVVDFARSIALNPAREALMDILRPDIKPATNDYIDQNPEVFATLVKDWKDMYAAADALRKPVAAQATTLKPGVTVPARP